MVSITSKTIENKTYFYLSHSYREDNKINVIEKSLGRKIPPDDEFEGIKEDFIKTIFLKRWSPTISKIKNDYNSSISKIPNFLNKKELEDFGIRFTFNSNKIEGSTLTLRETALIIKEKDVAINKPTRDINEAQAHMKCYEDMITTDEKLSMDLICKWHALLFKDHINGDIIAGTIREDNVRISGSDFIPPGPKLVKKLLKELFKWYDLNDETLNPVLLASIISFRFVTIHPFYDGNGRMSRLLMNYILFKNSYPMFNITYKIRKSYYSALEKSQIAFGLKKDETIFSAWFFKNYIKAFEDNLKHTK